MEQIKVSMSRDNVAKHPGSGHLIQTTWILTPTPSFLAVYLWTNCSISLEFPDSPSIICCDSTRHLTERIPQYMTQSKH